MDLDIQLQPKQMLYLQLVKSGKPTWLGMGGSRGGAKSFTLQAIQIIRRLENPGTPGVIIRRTYPSLKENHIDQIFLHWPELRQYWRASDKEIRFPNNSSLFFRSAETSEDVAKMIGTQYMDAGIDQAEQFTERELNTFKSCVRWPGKSPAFCKLLLTFNPGGIGANFLNRIFYKHQYNENEQAEDYEFIQAFGWDNWEWAKGALLEEGLTSRDYYSWNSDKRFDYFIKKSQYGRDLNSLPQTLRIGWLLGSMEKFAGQYYDCFSYERHIRPCRPQPWDVRTIGIDWGFAHPSAVLWQAQTGGRTIFYKEFCQPGRSPRALAQEIIDRTPADERKHIRKIFLSHDAFAKRDERDTIAQQMADVFVGSGLPYPEAGSKDVEGRAMLLYTMFQRDEVVIDPCCSKLIETIPMICHSQEEGKEEQTIKFDGDDSVDAAWYSLTYRLPGASKPKEVQLMEKANEISDPVRRWWFLRNNTKKPKSSTVSPNVVMAWQKLKPRSPYVV